LEKAPEAFRTISEVADDLGVPQHVLRFWESRFPQIRPMKRGGGRRYYRPDDVDLLRGIHHLLYGEGYTIRGVQRILREEGPRFVQSVWREGAPQAAPAAEDAEEETVFETTAADGDDSAGAPAKLSREGAQRLTGVLDELAECRRMLQAARDGT
jgi:DNA-binding transcriptional MerR regulator